MWLSYISVSGSPLRTMYQLRFKNCGWMGSTFFSRGWLTLQVNNKYGLTKYSASEAASINSDVLAGEAYPIMGCH